MTGERSSATTWTATAARTCWSSKIVGKTVSCCMFTAISCRPNNHWLGLHLVERPGRDSPLGATVVLTDAAGGQQIACVTVGDSIHAQHATTVHFGLAAEASVQSVEIHLVSGRVLTLDAPAVDQYHRVEID